MRMLAVLVFLAACGGSKPAPQAPAPLPPTTVAPPADPPPSARPTEAQQDAMFEGMLAMFEQIAKATQTHKGDCPAMAKAINTVIDGHAATLAEAGKWKDDAEIDARGKAYIEANEDRAKTAAESFFEGAMTCEKDAAVTAALARLED